jgi:hypothetical protein
LAAFATPLEDLEYLALPFRLATATAVFQRAITHKLLEFLGENVAVNLEDISVATINLEENFGFLNKKGKN